MPSILYSLKTQGTVGGCSWKYAYQYQHHVCHHCVKCNTLIKRTETGEGGGDRQGGSWKYTHTYAVNVSSVIHQYCVIHQYFVSYTNILCRTPIFCRVAETKTNTVVLTFCLFLGVSSSPAFTLAAAAPSTA